jgi:superfamily II DNA helicase RecQ
MRFTITSQGTDRPLELDICGYHLEVSDIDTGSISVSDSDSRISVRYIEPQTAVVEQVSAVAPQADVAVKVIETDLPVIEAEIPQATEPVKTVLQNVEVTELPEKLFSHLVALRKQIASEVNLPPYIIFHDSTLRDMCRLLPSDLEELRAVQGVGQAKLEKYGLRFIQAIHEFVSRIKEVA